MEYIKNPMMIEEKSFIMIQEIIDEIRPGYKFKNEIEEKIIKRSIHTTADFEYLDILKISDTAVENIVGALPNTNNFLPLSLAAISTAAIERVIPFSFASFRQTRIISLQLFPSAGVIPLK